MSRNAPLISLLSGLASLLSARHAPNSAAAYWGADAAFLVPGNFARSSSASVLAAAPKRFEDNADGVLYVNDKCINCAACANFAPTVFSRSPSDGHHIVHKQPTLDDATELDEARAALAACPVAAIRVENSASLNHKNLPKLSSEDDALGKMLAINPKANGLHLPFPRLLVGDGTGAPDVHFVGHHDNKSFGATTYLVRGSGSDGRNVSVMIDTPKFTPSAIRAVQSLTGDAGPDYMFLTHVDDVADHAKWSAEFPAMKRIFHSGDLGRHNWIGDTALEDVEVLLHGKDDPDSDELKAWTLDGDDASLDHAIGDFLVLHTPGHSPGSISLLFSPPGGGGDELSGVLFTGDTYAYSTRNGGSMSGFPRYGNDLHRQANVLKKLLGIGDRWDLIAPGHGQSRDYSSEEGKAKLKELEMEIALDDLKLSRKWR